MSNENGYPEKADIYLDFDSCVKIFQARGVVKGTDLIAKEVGYTPEGLRKVRKKGPKIIASIYHFLKDNDLKFEDLVKECETKN